MFTRYQNSKDNALHGTLYSTSRAGRHSLRSSNKLHPYIQLQKTIGNQSVLQIQGKFHTLYGRDGERTPTTGRVPTVAESARTANISNCTVTKELQIRWAIGEASALAREAARALQALQAGYKPWVRAIAESHFGSPLSETDIDIIIGVYRHIIRTLGNKAIFCDSCGPGGVATEEVSIGQPNPNHPPCALSDCPGSNIIICPPFFTPTCDQRLTILHEASHNAGACEDIRREPGKYPPTPDHGVNNSYSYENFAAEVAPSNER